MGNENNECLISKIDKNENFIEILNSVVGIMFRRVKEKTDSELSITNKKRLLESFEDVMKCLRRIELGNKNLYEKQEDNIEVLIELSETYDIEGEFTKLENEYKKSLNEEISFCKNDFIISFTNIKNPKDNKEYSLSTLKIKKEIKKI